MKHKFERNNKYYTICVYALITVLLCTIGIKLIINWDSTKSFIGTILDVLQPFIIGMFIAYIINPMTKFINYKILMPICLGKFKGVRKIISILLSYLIVISVISTVMFYIIPQIVDTLKQITSFINTAQTGYTSLMEKLESFASKHPDIDLSPVMNTIDKIPGMLAEFITDALPTVLPKIFSTSISFISSILNIIIALIVSVYMLIDKSRLINNSKRVVYALLGEKRGDSFLYEVSKCNDIFGNFIVGKTIDSLIIGFLCWVLMNIAGLPYALVISVIVGITNMIPYFGPFIGAVPGILLLVIVDFSYGIVFAILIIVLQQFDGLYLGPKILGESTGLRPLWIIFAITFGGFVAGPLGMFLGVPVVAVITYILDKFFAKKIISKNIEFEVDEETGVISRKDLIVDDTEQKNINLSEAGMEKK